MLAEVLLNSKSANWLLKNLTWAVFTLCAAKSVCADAAQPGSEMSYDFKAHQMTILGFYSPPAPGPNKKSGLEAELDARKNGLASLGAYLEKSCAVADSGLSADALKLQPNWKTALRSQGSEIFSNGALKIILTANLREVFKAHASTKPKTFKTAEGTPLYFSLPKLPSSAVKCGLVKFSISPRKNIFIVPVHISDISTNAKIISLTLADGNVLQAASQDDLAVLQKSDVSKLDSEGSGQSGSDSEVVDLPVAGG